MVRHAVARRLRVEGVAPGYFRPIIPLNAPNALTLARIALVPVMVLLVLNDETGALTAAAAVFIVASVTDAADGHLARSRNLITRFGRLADPVADKLLVGGALISLVAVDRLATWIAVVVIAREAFVSGLRWYAGTEGISIHVSGLGKAKTGAQMTAITVLMLVSETTGAWISAMLAVMVTLTVASGIDYLLSYLRQSPGPRTSPVTVARW